MIVAPALAASLLLLSAGVLQLPVQPDARSSAPGQPAAALIGTDGAAPSDPASAVSEAARADTLSYGRKAALTDSLFSALATDGSPGCAVGIVQDGETVFGKGYGHGNLDYDVPLDTRSSFYLASVSKQFIGAAVGLLVLDGTLALDQDVRDIVPELPDYGSPILIRHLLHHTSGIRDYLALFAIARHSVEDFFDNQDALELIARQEGPQLRTRVRISLQQLGLRPPVRDHRTDDGDEPGRLHPGAAFHAPGNEEHPLG